MPVNHRINVYLYEKQQKSKVKDNGSNTSAAATLSKNTQKQNVNSKPTSDSAGGKLSNILGTVVSNPAALIYGGLQTTNAGHNVWLDYKASISGNTMTAGNIKKAKSIALGFGMPYVYEALKNELFTKNVVHRQNIANQYYRDLYYEKYEGNQYDGKAR